MKNAYIDYETFRRSWASLTLQWSIKELRDMGFEEHYDWSGARTK